jgi:hypothetical protein
MAMSDSQANLHSMSTSAKIGLDKFGTIVYYMGG